MFMMDGEKASVFRPRTIEAISIAGYPGWTVYRVGNWVFTGGAEITDGLIGVVPGGCLVCSAIDMAIMHVNQISD